MRSSLIDALDRQLGPQDKELRAYARRQPGCKALTGQFGVGNLTAATTLAELGDARRFSASRDAVRYPGLGLVDGDVVRATLFVTQMRRGRLHARSCRHVRVDGPCRPIGRNACTSGITPPSPMSPTRSTSGP